MAPNRRCGGSCQRLAEHHGGQRREADATAFCPVALRGAGPRTAENGRTVSSRARCQPAVTSSPRSGRCERRRDDRGNRPIQPVRVRNRALEITMTTRSPSETARCTDRRRPQPGCFHVEGDEAVPRKSRFEIVQRGGEKRFESTYTQATFSPYYSKQKFLSRISCKNFTSSVVNGVVLGVRSNKRSKLLIENDF